MLPGTGRHGSGRRTQRVTCPTGINNVGVHHSRVADERYIKVTSDISSVARSKNIFKFCDRPVASQACWVNPAFNGEAASKSHVQTGSSVDQHKVIYPIQVKRIAYFSSGKARAVHQSPVVTTYAVIGITLGLPPCHHARQGRRGDDAARLGADFVNDVRIYPIAQ